MVVSDDEEEEEDKPKEKATKSKKKVSEKNHYLKIMVGPRSRYFNFQHEM